MSYTLCAFLPRRTSSHVRRWGLFFQATFTGRSYFLTLSGRLSHVVREETVPVRRLLPCPCCNERSLHFYLHNHAHTVLRHDFLAMNSCVCTTSDREIGGRAKDFAYLCFLISRVVRLQLSTVPNSPTRPRQWFSFATRSGCQTLDGTARSTRTTRNKKCKAQGEQI